MIKTLITSLYEAIFPPLCCGCLSEGTQLCKTCFSQLICERPQCIICSKLNSEWQICDQCKQTTPLEYIIAPFQYQGIAAKIIHSLKYENNRKIITVIAELLKASIEKNKHIIKNSLIIPIPAHPKRTRERGFNQTIDIAKYIALQTASSISHSLIRIKNTQKLAQKNSTDRQKQIHGAFAVREKIDNKRIMLIDDVYTTGSTLAEAAHTIKQLDEKISISAMVFARTEKEALL